MARKKLKKSQVEALGRKWQKRLRLQDWVISYSVQRREEFANSGAAAEMRHFSRLKVASVAVLDPIDRHKDPWVPYDVEIDIVHELLHLLLLPVEPAQPEKRRYTEFEQVIHILSEALVRGRRNSDTAKASV